MAVTDPSPARAGEYSLNDRFLSDQGPVFLTGIQALARLPLEQLRADRRAGLNTAAFVSGYQGSPLGGYGDAVANAAKLAPDLPVVVEPGMNEEYGATAVMGSQLAVVQPNCRYEGVVGIWYGKAPGVDRAADALRHAVFTGSSMLGGAVAIVGDDPLAKSSTVPSTSAGVLHSMHLPLLYPGDPNEALQLGRHAITLSRVTGLWVALKIVADVADATASVDLDPEPFDPVIPLVDGAPYQHQPDGRLLTPHTLDLEREIIDVRYELARRYVADNRLNRVTADASDAWIGIVASGITYREVREALRRLGLRDENEIGACGIRLLKMGMPMPFNAETMRRFAVGLEQIVVIEEKTPNIESLLKDALYALAERPVVVGKHDEHGQHLFPAWGSLDADGILPLLRSRLEGRLGDRLVPDRPTRTRIPVAVTSDFGNKPDDDTRTTRTPFYCSGCPHNRSTEAPDGALVGAGIGCHTMTLLMDPERVGDIAAITCMGNEGTQWIGMSPFLGPDDDGRRPHLFQNLGDGTYFHSGQLAIQATVAAGVDITYKLLYNGTVAMTGGQDPEGQRPVADICKVLLAQGVSRILITTSDVDEYDTSELPRGIQVWDRSRLIEAQEALAAIRGTTVLIHDQACAAEARRDRKRGTIPTPPDRVLINPRICEGCGDCGEISNCLSVQPIDTPFGPRRHIDQTTCNLDYSCLEGDCPSFMTVTFDDPELARTGGRSGQSGDAVIPPGDLPEPAAIVPTDEFALRITGIGGTGVVTVAQVLGTAAMLDGYHVRGLDQIGLSQKAGPVVSDVRLSRDSATPTNRLGEAQADLLLAFDQLVAASERGLLTADPERTTVVGSSSATPTGAMITDLALRLPAVEELAGEIAAVTRGDAQFWADADAITSDLFGTATTANIFVVGMAAQAGCLPIPVSQLEQAIELNGVAVAQNLAAFRWGRAQIARPDAVDAARNSVAKPAPAEAVPPPEVARRLEALDLDDPSTRQLDLLAVELGAWGSTDDVERWLDVIERVRRTEAQLAVPDTALTTTVAQRLYQLTAYKDEYEVARLMVDADATAEARTLAAAGGKLEWKLHPPMLRALGFDSKISVGRWAEPGVRALAKGKRLRGSRLDPFGWAKVRRVERVLADEYLDAVDAVLATVTADTYDDAVTLADLPSIVRGYEDIKLANVERYRRAMAEARRAF